MFEEQEEENEYTMDGIHFSEIQEGISEINLPACNGSYTFNLIVVGDTQDDLSDNIQGCGNCPEHPRNGGAGDCLWDFVQYSRNGRLGAICEYLDENTGLPTQCYGEDNWQPDLKDDLVDDQYAIAIKKKGWFYRELVKEFSSKKAESKV